MASKRDKDPIDVTWEDQRSICTFGRLHRRHQALIDLIKVKKQEVENLSDASDECLIADEVAFVFGESFVHLNSDKGRDLVEERKGETERELHDMLAEKEALWAIMTKLKGALYAKFGSQIYLEAE